MALQRCKDQAMKLLREKNAVTDVLAMVEEKTGAPRLYVAGGGSFRVLVFPLLFFFFQLIA